MAKFWELLLFFAVIVLGFTPILWFIDKGRALLNGVDINFPLDPMVWFVRRLYVWNSITNGGGDFSSSTAGLFFHSIQTLPFILGFDLQVVQIISLVVWFLLIVLSAYLFSKVVLLGNRVSRLLFVVLYSFNVYLFNTWESIKVANLSLMASILFGLTFFVMLQEKKINKTKAALASIFVGVVLSGAGINPAYFLCFFAILFWYVFVDVVTHCNWHYLKLSLQNFGLIALVIVAVNMFWILPTAHFILSNISASHSIDSLGFTNWTDSLSENTSIFNILRLLGAWDWYAFDGVSKQPLFIPYAGNYFFNLPFIIFSVMIPILAFTSLIFQDKKRYTLYVFSAFMIIWGTFLGTGTHLPTGYFYRLLINYVPFFSLFRSPWYIFTPMLIIAYGILLALLFDLLVNKVSSNKYLVVRIIPMLCAALLIIGNLVYCYPLVTGKIFRPGMQDNDFYVNFPEYVFETAGYVNKIPQVRIIGYPDDEIERFSWGYRSIESVLSLFSSREVLFSPVNLGNSDIVGIIKSFYLALKKGELARAKILADKLNVGFILEKRDQSSLAMSISDSVSRYSKYRDFGLWRVYSFPEDVPQKIFTASSLALGYWQGSSGEALSRAEGKVILVDPEDGVVKQIPNYDLHSGKIISAKNLQVAEYEKFGNSVSELKDRLVSRDFSKAQFEVDAPQEGNYAPVLDNFRLAFFGIDATKSLTMDMDGKNIDWEPYKNNDSGIYYKPIFMSQGKHIFTIDLKNKNLVLHEDFQNSKAEFIKNGELSITAQTDGTNENYITLVNKSHLDAGINFLVKDFSPLSRYMINVRYKQVYGNNPGIGVVQKNDNALVKSIFERMPNYPEWNNFSIFYYPVVTKSALNIILSAPPTADPLGTKLSYDDLSVYEVFSNNLQFYQPSKEEFNAAGLTYQQLSPVKYKGFINQSTDPQIIVFSENFSPEWEMKIFTKNDKDKKIVPKHFKANGYANGWFVERQKNGYDFEIVYKPQRLFWFGTIASLIIVGCIITINLISLVKLNNYGRKTKS